MKLPPVERNEGVSKKMAKSVAASIETYRLKEFGNDPIATPCQWLLVSSVNRMGQCLTLSVVWQIAISLMDDGCDPDRTGLGICVWFKRQETKLRAIRDNLKKYGGSPLYPPIEEEDVKGETLAASHYNTALRCFRAGMKTASGRALVVDEADTDLKLKITQGHVFIRVSEDMPVDEQKQISEWKNMDQNTNQVIHEMMRVRALEEICLKEASVAHSVSVTTVASKLNLTSAIKCSNSVLCSLARWVLAMGAGSPQIDRVANHHALKVNPNTLTLPHGVYDAIGQHLAVKWKDIAAGATMAGYGGDDVQPQLRPRPDIGKVVTKADVEYLVTGRTEEAVLDAIDKMLREASQTYTSTLGSVIGEGQAKVCVDELYIAAARMMMTKQWSPEFRPSQITTGKATVEKFSLLTQKWITWVDGLFPGSSFAERCGQKKAPVTVNKEGDEYALPHVEQPWQPGEECVFVRKVTIDYPLPKEPDYRFDVTAGHEAFVKHVDNINDKEPRIQVVFHKKIKDVMRRVEESILAHNFKRPSKDDPKPKATAKSKAVPKDGREKGAAPPWTDLPEKARATVVKANWSSMTSAADADWQLHRGKCAAITAVAMIDECCEWDYDKEDFTIVKRDSSLEVWTSRNFTPYEIMLSPVTTNIKDAYYTLGRSVLTKDSSHHHPEHKHFVLDGRTGPCM